eukprot:Skav205437  [mRNA]  locus=scaffold2500:255355:264724:+ [translate_table: standard]
MVQDAFVVEAADARDADGFLSNGWIQVHEYWAQVALEFGDFKQFDQAAAQLEEVLAWRLLYFTVEGEGLATTEFMRRHSARLDDTPVMKFALRLRRVMSQRCFSQAIKLLQPAGADVPALPQSLRNELLRRARLLQLMALCKALSKDKLTKETLDSFGLLEETAAIRGGRPRPWPGPSPGRE